MTVGEKLRALRGTRKKKIIADAIGVSYNTYVKYERDERRPGDDTKKKIANFFGVSIESIFFE